MILSCCTWALSGPEHRVLEQVAAAGFRWIDVRPFDFTSTASQSRIRALPLRVSCMGVSFGMPEGAALESPDRAAAEEALEYTGRALQAAARLGAAAVYVVPGMDGRRAALTRYADAMAAVAEQASPLGLKVCIEHFPGRALPTVSATLEFIRAVGHPGLYLLFDIGHAQIAGEDAAEAVTAAGDRLGYVHLDDNDGREDRHLPLLEGVMTEESLQRLFAALHETGYQGAVSLELNPSLPDPLHALKRSRDIVTRLASAYLA